MESASVVGFTTTGTYLTTYFSDFRFLRNFTFQTSPFSLPSRLSWIVPLLLLHLNKAWQKQVCRSKSHTLKQFCHFLWMIFRTKLNFSSKKIKKKICAQFWKIINLRLSNYFFEKLSFGEFSNFSISFTNGKIINELEINLNWIFFRNILKLP